MYEITLHKTGEDLVAVYQKGETCTKNLQFGQTFRNDIRSKNNLDYTECLENDTNFEERDRKYRDETMDTIQGDSQMIRPTITHI